MQKVYLLSISRRILKIIAKLRQLLPLLTYFSPSPSHLSHTLEAVVDIEKKYVFILNPKVGSRSIVDVLSRFKNTHVVYINPKLAKNFKDLGFNFYSFIRNPVERALSCYRQKFNTSDLAIKNIHSKLGAKNEFSLSEFIKFISTESKDDSISDKHWAAQHYLLGINGVLNIDEFKLFNFNNFSKELVKFVQKKYNVTVDVPHILATSQSKINVSNEDIGLLKERYKLDFKFFKEIINE